MNKEQLVSDVIQFIEEHYKENITIEQISKEFYIDRFYLMKIFKGKTDISIVEYLNIIRILNSIVQLLKTDDTILKIAISNGYNSQEYYSEQFSKVLGINPTLFRKQNFLEITNKINIEEYNYIEKLKINYNLVNDIKLNNLRIKGEIKMNNELNELMKNIDERLKNIMGNDTFELERKREKSLDDFNKQFGEKVNELLSMEFKLPLDENVEYIDSKLSKEEQNSRLKEIFNNKYKWNKLCAMNKITVLENRLELLKLEQEYNEFKHNKLLECDVDIIKRIQTDREFENELFHKWYNEFFNSRK